MGFVLPVDAIENSMVFFQLLKRKYIHIVAMHWDDVTKHTNDAYKDLEKCGTVFSLLAAPDMALRTIFISLIGIKPYWSGFHNFLVSKISLKISRCLVQDTQGPCSTH